jgi:hypothetical protein
MRRNGQSLLPYCPLALAVATSVTLQLRGERTGPFLYWAFVALVLLIVGRQLITVLDNQALNRRLASMVGTLEDQAFHDGLTNLPNRALFRERVGHALRRRSQAGTPLALLFIDRRAPGPGRGQRRRHHQRRHRGRRRPPRGRRRHVHRQGPRQEPLRAGLELGLAH